MDGRSMSDASTPASAVSASASGPSYGRLALGVAIVGGLFILLFWDFLERQVRWAIDQQADWGHTLVIPGIAIYMGWLLRARLFDRPLRRNWLGIAPVILGVLVYSVCIFGPPVLHHHNLRAVGVAITITGLVHLFGGWHAIRVLWFPLCYLFLFGQTISDRFMHIVTYQMQDITARGAWILMAVAQLDVERDGNTIILFKDGVPSPVNVAEACSGMRMLMAFLALGSAMAFTGLRRWWQRILLIVAGIPTAIFVNILRVITLSLLSLIDTGFAAGDFHSFIGLLWLIPAFVIYLAIGSLIRRLSPARSRSAPEFPPLTEPIRVGPGAPAAVIAAAIVLIGSAAGFQAAVAQLNVYLRKEPVALRESLDTLPTRLGTWSGIRGEKLPEEMVETLGTREYFDVSYSDGDRRVALHAAYYTGFIDAVPHVPDRCMVAAGYDIIEQPTNFPLELRRTGWRFDGTQSLDGEPFERVMVKDAVTGRARAVRMPLGDPRIRITVFTDADDPSVRLVAGYFFIANGVFTATPGGVKALAFDPTEPVSYYCKVQFTTAVTRQYELDDFIDLVTDILDPLLPELMRCLPDWHDVETSGTEDKG